jgi:hypothetical protein
MDTSTRVVMGQAGDYEWNQPFSSGGWFMLRSAPNITSTKIAGVLLSRMDSTQHYRGWDVEAEQGLIIVKLANQAPKEVPPKEKPKKGAKKAEPKKEEAKKAEPKEPKDLTPIKGIKVTTTVPLPTDGNWDHVFFTYDGSGKAAGVKIYVNGAPAVTKIVSDNLGQLTVRTPVPLQLGRISPDEQPARDTRYQDFRGFPVV